MFTLFSLAWFLNLALLQEQQSDWSGRVERTEAYSVCYLGLVLSTLTHGIVAFLVNISGLP